MGCCKLMLFLKNRIFQGRLFSLKGSSIFRLVSQLKFIVFQGANKLGIAIRIMNCSVAEM
jgi:hypothetical protein